VLEACASFQSGSLHTNCQTDCMLAAECDSRGRTCLQLLLHMVLVEVVLHRSANDRVGAD
jgi:hypothetical protein